MFRLLVFFFVMVASCNNEDAPADALLENPPYKTLTDSIRITPANADLYYRRGSLLYQNNHMLRAEQDLRSAWRLSPKEEHALSLTTILKQKNTDSAIVFLQEAIKRLPGSIALQIGLARGFQQKGQRDKALAVVDQIIRQYPNQLDALIVKSEILKETNKTAEALAILETAVSYAPNDLALAYDLAYEYAEAKRPRALTLTDTLLQFDSTETAARGFYVKATYYKNIGKPNDALKNYDAAIIKNYTFLDAYLDKGELLYAQRNYEASLKNFEKALNISPSTAEFFFWIGKNQEAMGNKADAKLNYQRAYSLDKSITEAKEAADRL